MRLFLRILLVAFLALVVVLLWNTYRFPSRQLTDIPPAAPVPVGDSAIQHLSRSIQFRTVSYQDAALTDTTQFEAFIAFLESTYPRLHAQLKRERINDLALLYQWPGTNPALPPMLLMGHYDVVPVIQGTERMWKKPPFAGLVEDGFVYGRGTLDDKSTVIGLLEAVEYLLQRGYQPARTVYLAFGHDEEIGGKLGAQTIASTLQQRGIKLDMVMDEGGTIKTDGVAGLKAPVALIGVAEKGYTSLELRAQGEGGHSSMPPRKTSIGMLATALDNLQRSPFKSSLGGTVGEMLNYLGPEMSFGQKLAIANRWLLAPVLVRALSGTNSGAASTHTTIAPTMLNAGIKDNVLPIDATAIVNFRILPGDSVQGVIEHVKRVIDNPDISVRSLAEFDAEPSPVSPPEAEPFRVLQRSIQSCYPGVVVTPYLVLGATDARYYRHLSENVYRFTPYQLDEEDLKRPHGTNERISVGTFKEMIRFYATFIQDRTK
ncbi:M20 family peptidase [Rhabdobacter roseus]|uniref:Carboxypeptidase PM20D1 n=1 Tax=Rhabdobacter roseus TaxID=1655419 RepID=A0A840TWG8_9BACT|nr:M20 family peptidase [Rhabdobacter roseus]MBB5283989.1 carboxypeptidase PM20D1 [Rhabdobacter roseus]